MQQKFVNRLPPSTCPVFLWCWIRILKQILLKPDPKLFFPQYTILIKGAHMIHLQFVTRLSSTTTEPVFMRCWIWFQNRIQPFSTSPFGFRSMICTTGVWLWIRLFYSTYLVFFPKGSDPDPFSN